jgi:hypothetical protein
MHVAVDKAGDGKAPFGVDLLMAPVAVEGANNLVSANGNVTGLNLAGNEIQDAGIADDKIGRQPAQGLIDLSLQSISHDSITPPEVRSGPLPMSPVWFPYYRINHSCSRANQHESWHLRAHDTMELSPSCPLP